MTETPGIHDASGAPQPSAVSPPAAPPASVETVAFQDAPKLSGLSFVPGVLSEERLRSLGAFPFRFNFVIFMQF